MSKRANQTIDEFAPRVTKPDWDSYSSEPITPETIAFAKEIIGYLPGEWSVVPCGNGSIQISRNNEEQQIEVWAAANKS